jgi:hypothetical protein
MMRRALGGALALALAVSARPASGAPQANLGVTLGGAAAGLRTEPHAAFHLGARGDLIFLRERDADMGVGPYVELLTVAFDTLETGGGGEWLVPFSNEFAFVFSGGAYARRAPGYAWEPGVATGIFVGGRSYNFSSLYALGTGLFVQGRYGLGDAKQADVLIGVQLDLSVFAFPFIFAYEALRH